MQATQNVTAFENNEKPIIDLLDRHLASAIDLQLQLRSALWNMEDPRLSETRELDTTASEIEQFCNLIAERLRALGAVAQATPQRVQVRSFLDPYPPAVARDEDYIFAIERALAKLRHSARQARERAAAFCDESDGCLVRQARERHRQTDLVSPLAIEPKQGRTMIASHDRLKLERLGNAQSIEKAAAGFTDLDTIEICGCAPEIIRGRVQRGLARLVELLPAQSSALCSQ